MSPMCIVSVAAERDGVIVGEYEAAPVSTFERLGPALLRYVVENLTWRMDQAGVPRSKLAWMANLIHDVPGEVIP